jgi:hypothetical protein
MVNFMPNLTWFNGGSTIIGYGVDSLNWCRERLATGRDPESQEPVEGRFAGRTDARGTVAIRNLPGGTDELYMVGHPEYVARDTLPEYALVSMPAGFQKVTLNPGESGNTRVVMVKNPQTVNQAQRDDGDASGPME